MDDLRSYTTSLTLEEAMNLMVNYSKEFYPECWNTFSISDWTTALTGELGEFANQWKKHLRMRLGIQKANQPSNYGESYELLQEECLQILQYWLLLYARLHAEKLDEGLAPDGVIPTPSIDLFVRVMDSVIGKLPGDPAIRDPRGYVVKLIQVPMHNMLNKVVPL